MKMAVDDHWGLFITAFTTLVANDWPARTDDGGCSLTSPLGTTHETAGSVPFRASVNN